MILPPGFLNPVYCLEALQDVLVLSDTPTLSEMRFQCFRGAPGSSSLDYLLSQEYRGSPLDRNLIGDPTAKL